MAGKAISIPYDAITYKIIGCAMAVHTVAIQYSFKGSGTDNRFLYTDYSD
jgi:hypothetical protein